MAFICDECNEDKDTDFFCEECYHGLKDRISELELDLSYREADIAKLEAEIEQYRQK